MPLDDFLGDELLEKYADWLAWLRAKIADLKAQIARIEKNKRKADAVAAPRPAPVVQAIPLETPGQETEMVEDEPLSEPLLAAPPETSPSQPAAGKGDPWI